MLLQVGWNASGEVIIATTVKGVTDSFDERQKLGTTTLNNRDYWENLNFNSNNFQPYLTDDRIIFETALFEENLCAIAHRGALATLPNLF